MPSTPKQPSSDEDLMRRYQNGDKAALADLISRFRTVLATRAQRESNWAINEADAEQIADDTMTKVSLNAHTFADIGEKSVRNWIFKINKNNTIDFMRSGEHKVSKAAFAIIDEQGSNEIDDAVLIRNGVKNENIEIDQQIAEHQVATRLMAAIQKLPHIEREVIILHYLQKCTGDEMSQILGISTNKVKYYHQKALRRLWFQKRDIDPDRE